MLYAINPMTKERIRPTPGEHAECPVCEQEVIPKCGEINVWHFAHMPAKGICPYGIGESRWHLARKRYYDEQFPGCAEVLRRDEQGQVRVADVFLPASGTVMEFQHSPINTKEWRVRTEFWLAQPDVTQVWWIFDANKLRDNKRVWIENDGGGSTTWSFSSRYLKGVIEKWKSGCDRNGLAIALDHTDHLKPWSDGDDTYDMIDDFWVEEEEVDEGYANSGAWHPSYTRKTCYLGCKRMRGKSFLSLETSCAKG